MEYFCEGKNWALFTHLFILFFIFPFSYTHSLIWILKIVYLFVYNLGKDTAPIWWKSGMSWKSCGNFIQDGLPFRKWSAQTLLLFYFYFLVFTLLTPSTLSTNHLWDHKIIFLITVLFNKFGYCMVMIIMS